MGKTNKTAVIYARIRTEFQKKAEGIIENQNEKCKAYALSKDMDVVAYFSDQQFGDFDHNVDGFENLFKYVKNHKVDYVIIQSMDRISRSPMVHQGIEKELKQYGTSIIATEEVPLNHLLDLE